MSKNTNDVQQQSDSDTTQSSHTQQDHRNIINTDVFIMTDSHGKRIDPKKMYYTRVKASIKTLRDKTLEDASRYIDKVNIES